MMDNQNQLPVVADGGGGSNSSTPIRRSPETSGLIVAGEERMSDAQTVETNSTTHMSNTQNYTIEGQGSHLARARVFQEHEASPVLHSIARSGVVDGEPIVDLAGEFGHALNITDTGVTRRDQNENHSSGTTDVQSRSAREMDRQRQTSVTPSILSEDNNNNPRRNTYVVLPGVHEPSQNTTTTQHVRPNRSNYDSDAISEQSRAVRSTAYPFYSVLREGNAATSTQIDTTGTASSHTSPAVHDATTDTSRVLEASANARRDLERALREYRIARRMFRDHFPHLDGEGSRSDSVGRRDASVVRERRSELPAEDSSTNARSQNLRPQARIEEMGRSVPTAAALRAAQLSWRYNLSRMPNIESREEMGTENRHLTATSLRDAQSSRASNPTLQQSDGVRGSSNVNRISPDRILRMNQTLDNHRRRRTQLPESSTRRKANNTLRYLTALKHCGRNEKGSCEIARSLGLNSAYSGTVAERTVDLPAKIDELPRPVHSSWLEPGVRWSGEQTGGNAVKEETLTSGPLFNRSRQTEDPMERIFSLRAWRHRERVRTERLETERLQNEGGLRSTSRGDQDSALLDTELLRNNSLDVLADVERHLSNLLEEEERRLSSNDSWSMSTSILGRQQDRMTLNGRRGVVEDKWPVKVMLHSVDWKKKRVTGTMSASHIPDRSKVPLGTAPDPDEKPETNSMESFFDGEIIDFRHNEIETLADKEGYQTGGTGTDVQYWAGLGPFKEEVERHKMIARYEKQVRDARSKDSTNTNSVQDIESEFANLKNEDNLEAFVQALRDNEGAIEAELDKDENDKVVDETMARCLGSKKWMETKLESWVLMRWKERCFVATPDSDSNNSTTLTSADGNTLIHHPHPRPRSQHNVPTTSAATAWTSSISTYDHSPTNASSPSWGLTISGFYYVALHRMSGKIEGLYFDPGSQPYQRLVMWPTDSMMDPKVRSSLPSSSSPPSRGVESDEQPEIEDLVIGIRRGFPAVEFR